MDVGRLFIKAVGSKAVYGVSIIGTIKGNGRRAKVRSKTSIRVRVRVEPYWLYVESNIQWESIGTQGFATKRAVQSSV